MARSPCQFRLAKSLLFSVSTSSNFHQLLPSVGPSAIGQGRPPKGFSTEGVQRRRSLAPAAMLGPGIFPKRTERQIRAQHGGWRTTRSDLCELLYVQVCVMCSEMPHVLSVSLHARRVRAVEGKSERAFIMLLRGPAVLAVWTEPDYKHGSRN